MALSHLLPCPECVLCSQTISTSQHGADMSAVRRSRHVCCMTCLLCDTARMSGVSHSRHVCCGTQQKCLLRDTADMSAV